MSAPSFSEAAQTFGKIGLLSFGGPAGQIALMHKILVDEKKWLEEKQYLNALNFCMLLPGPEAMQLATYAGWLLHGVKGGLMAGLLFVLPGRWCCLALSSAYVFLGDQTWMAGLLFGLSAAVLALVLEALLRVSKRALKSRFAYVIAALAFVAIALLKLPFPLVVLLAAAAGIVRYRMMPRGSEGQHLAYRRARLAFLHTVNHADLARHLAHSAGAAVLDQSRQRLLQRRGSVLFESSRGHVWRRLCGSGLCGAAGG